MNPRNGEYWKYRNGSHRGARSELIENGKIYEALNPYPLELLNSPLKKE
jgi:hypothetical protein